MALDFKYVADKDIAALETSCAVFFSSSLEEEFTHINAKWAHVAHSAQRESRFSRKVGSSFLINLWGEDTKVKNVLMVSFGENKEEQTHHGYHKAITEAWKKLAELRVEDAVFILPSDDCVWMVRQIVLVGEHVLYNYNDMRSKISDDHTCTFSKAWLFVSEQGSKMDSLHGVLRESMSIAAGISFTKDLGNAPANICTPYYLASRAKALSSEMGMTANTISLEQAKEMGMGAFAAVSQGSKEPACLIEISYKNSPNKDDSPYVLVGKGVTFDSGGISIKPSACMDEMKFDMCGAATVLGVMKAIALLKLPINVVGIIPATENMPGGCATRPGDIVKTMSGQTVEILNTDAEGRLILCDALTYAERFNPKVVVDIATLTGACVVALGNEAAAIYTRPEDYSIRNDIVSAGEKTLDRAWPMPLWEEYQEQLKSKFADFANIGTRWGGSVTAACFLSRFTRNYKWAHLDIAGVAWVSGQGTAEATGRPVAMLSQWLISQSNVVS